MGVTCLLYPCVAAARGRIPVSTNLQRGYCRQQVQDFRALEQRTLNHDQLAAASHFSLLTSLGTQQCQS